ncbi:tRNA (guanine(26)-N(2))-dimethyltransferase isoform X3 [Ananas comosus]|uniref:tRNA (guanine(26)-N(2))-dimethyltransferase n=1 Tax=Ananas comosus TaxID=4615 RepID=A0A6P5ER25_ANACO|nr:tRNA (guanine(26)-N(2))-dimethyltransferase isoform X3 [Ananas comosus]
MFALSSVHPILLPHPLNPNPSPRRIRRTRTRTRRRTLTPTSSREAERGVEFETGDSFFRRESAVGRDLGVLSASLLRRCCGGGGGGLRVLDAMCGCGVRALRYLAQGGADFVWANDAFEGSRPLVLANLAREPRFSTLGERRWVVTHFGANRVLADCYLRREFFDLVDVDSFGSDSSFLRSGIAAVKIGGLLYVTSTCGRSSGGHRPRCSLASYGAYVRPVPYSNEIGLRMLLGGALREAAAVGFQITPLFSYYSYHAPVFRVMLQVSRGKDHDFSHYGFISYCKLCGHSQTYSWDELGQISCPCRNGEVSSSVVVSGPLWTGPLHDAAYLSDMLRLATEWGWAYTDGKGNGVDLEKLLNLMIEESDPLLPSGYIKLDEIASRARINSPPLATLINSLRRAYMMPRDCTQEGYAACRSHIAPNAVKTNCPMASCLELAHAIRHQR